jgi:tRNA uridine 5-carboxymethylaminomethyl modification enzyme
LHLRIDNADRRLTPHGRRVGLIRDADWSDYLAKQERMKALREVLGKTVASGQWSVASDGCEPLMDLLDKARAAGVTLAQLLKRPEVQIEQLAPVLMKLMPEFFERDSESLLSNADTNDSREQQVPPRGLKPLVGMTNFGCRGSQLTTENRQPTTPRLSAEIRNELKSVETEIKYSGYLDQQTKAIERLKRSEQRTIPDWFDYGKVSGLSREMNEKLTRVRPQTLGQASRIPGVTPAAVSLINVYIEIQARRQAGATSRV